MRQAGGAPGVVACANVFWIYANTREPFKSTFSCDPFFDGSATSTFIQIDGARERIRGTDEPLPLDACSGAGRG